MIHIHATLQKNKQKKSRARLQSLAPNASMTGRIAIKHGSPLDIPTNATQQTVDESRKASAHSAADSVQNVD
jgi:hypothetical protein